jgi:hypothetical protein
MRLLLFQISRRGIACTRGDDTSSARHQIVHDQVLCLYPDNKTHTKVRFVDIDGIDDRYCLYFIFIGIPMTTNAQLFSVIPEVSNI